MNFPDAGFRQLIDQIAGKTSTPAVQPGNFVHFTFAKPTREIRAYIDTFENGARIKRSFTEEECEKFAHDKDHLNREAALLALKYWPR